MILYGGKSVLKYIGSKSYYAIFCTRKHPLQRYYFKDRLYVKQIMPNCINYIKSERLPHGEIILEAPLPQDVMVDFLYIW